MWSILKSIKARTIIGMIVGTLGGISTASGYGGQQIFPPRGSIQSPISGGQPVPTQRVEAAAASFPGTGNLSASPSAKPSAPGPRSVKLSWNASVPATPSPTDAVTGYRIYRSTSMPVEPISKNRIDCVFVSVTSCIDQNVEPGQTYHYVATALAGRAPRERESAPSKPAEVTIRIP